MVTGLPFPPTPPLLHTASNQKLNGGSPKNEAIVQQHIDGFTMPIKYPTSGGQARNQEAAVQRTFHLERSSSFQH